MATKQKMVTAVFRNRLNADDAWNWLVEKGYRPQDINMLMSETTKSSYYNDQESNMSASSHVAEGIAAGGAVGTAVGATAAAIAAIGTSLVIPALGLVIAGPIAAAFAGGSAGAVAGGAIGGFVGLGIPESNARAYESILRDGGVAIGVVPRRSEDASSIQRKFEELHGENVITI